MRLLGHGALLPTHIPADISSVCRLLDDIFESSPGLTSSRRRALIGKLCVNASSELGDGVLDEAALCVTSTEKDSVDNNEDPRALLEKES